jgi:hypothetical protein
MALELVDVEGEFEGGAKLQAHVFHHHVAAQQQEGSAVNLLEEGNRNKNVKNNVTGPMQHERTPFIIVPQQVVCTLI